MSAVEHLGSFFVLRREVFDRGTLGITGFGKARRSETLPRG